MIWSVVTLVAVLVGIPWGLLAIPVGLSVHAGLRWMFSIDHKIVDIYMVHELVPNNLHAGYPSHGETCNSRPRGYAKTLPLH